MDRNSALSLAKEKGLDLIEISPSAKPPVARILSFDKFRYQQEKKEKKQRAQQKTQELKQIQISVGEARHDLERKAQQVNEFMVEGNQVEVLMVLRGRQKAHKDFARERLKAFLQMIDPEHKIIMEPRQGARGISVQIAKK